MSINKNFKDQFNAKKNAGTHGEDLAEAFLIDAGYEILERNFRHGKGEVDIISLLDNSLLVFVEVKLRKTGDFGEPEAFVSQQQSNRIIQVADHYIHAINWQRDIRFDVISIRSDTGEVKWFKDAFY
ncbi:MAG: YraN family protein [Cytophagales bacterium]|nr:YraN family protein [Cytophagales bacterium]